MRKITLTHVSCYTHTQPNTVLAKLRQSTTQVVSTKPNFTVCPQDLTQSSSLLLLPVSLLDLGIFQTDVRATSPPVHTPVKEQLVCLLHPVPTAKAGGGALYTNIIHEYLFFHLGSSSRRDTGSNGCTHMVKASWVGS